MSDTSTTPEMIGDIIDLTPKERLIKKAKAHRGLQFGGAVVVLMTLVAIFAPLIAPYSPYDQNLAHRLAPPIWSDSGSWGLYTRHGPTGP